ncbi:MAG: hypothetical protein LBG06_11410, partial [Deltaproteobacteria bacterium]|nr:hypothetical protein [Deltaproteobacteria bacterium]
AGRGRRAGLAALFRRGRHAGKAAFAVNLGCSVGLGLVFIWAAIQKIRDPSATLAAVLSFRALPAALAPGAALFLPWLELWAGVFTVTGPGYFRRAGALILSGLLLLFMAAAALALARGLDSGCGCFGAGDGRPGAVFFLRDTALLLLGLEIVFHRMLFGRKPRPAEASPAGSGPPAAGRPGRTGGA